MTLQKRIIKAYDKGKKLKIKATPYYFKPVKPKKKDYKEILFTPMRKPVIQ